jgi:hypothetical protein
MINQLRVCDILGPRKGAEYSNEWGYDGVAIDKSTNQHGVISQKLHRILLFYI